MFRPKFVFLPKTLVVVRFGLILTIIWTVFKILYTYTWFYRDLKLDFTLSQANIPSFREVSGIILRAAAGEVTLPIVRVRELLSPVGVFSAFTNSIHVARRSYYM